MPEGLEPGTPFSVGIVALAIYLRFVHAISYRRLSRRLLELFGLASPNAVWSLGACCIPILHFVQAPVPRESDFNDMIPGRH